MRPSRLDTIAPVDVIKADTITNQASTELAQGLSAAAPSIDFPRPAVTDGTDSVRPATLRGLSPDQALVLINGKRRHASSLVNINGSVGRGSAAVDLNTVPESALNGLEILRDGASAQYGSDAIAGVINLKLRKADHGGNLTAGFSEYITKVKGPFSSRDAYDGRTYSVSGWSGFKLGSDGFLTLSGELKSRAPTSRGDVDKRSGAPVPFVVTSRFGDPAERAVTLFANASKPLGNDWESYGFASYQNRKDQSAANFRQSTNSGNVPALYPNGFLPLIDAHTEDYAATGGLKGNWGEWATDLSLTYGNNKLSYATANSVNASLGAASKKGFYDGYMQYGEWVADANFSQGFDIKGLYTPLNVAIGFEGRKETYKIAAGELQSYQNGNAVGGTLPAGAQGFPGFTPGNATNAERTNIGVYVDTETNFTQAFSAGFAARAEHYSDFGDNLSGKLGARYDFTPSFALRGAISTGFRAPSLQQQYFTSTATNFIVVGGVNQPFEITTFPVSSSVAKALGAVQLRPEKSTNYSFGGVFHKGPFEVTLDGYQIRITDRIILSENILRTFSPAVAALLGTSGGGRFFINGVNTQTRGVDLVAHYRLKTASLGSFDFSLAANNSNTLILKQPFVNTQSTLTPAPALFARVNQNLLADSTPENKDTLSIDWKSGDWGISTLAVYYGKILIAQSTATLDYYNKDATLVNLSVRYKIPKSKTVISFGADNLFDQYPTQLPANLRTLAANGINTSSFNGGAVYSGRSPYGFNGRNVFVKISQNF